MPKKKKELRKQSPREFFNDDDGYCAMHRESFLEEFGEGDPTLKEDGTIVDGRGNVLVRPY